MVDIEKIRHQFGSAKRCRGCGRSLAARVGGGLICEDAFLDGGESACSGVVNVHHGHSPDILALCDEVERLRDEVAEARGLRLGRAPTVDESDRHMGGNWLLLEPHGWTTVTGLAGLRWYPLDVVTDAIPLDANGQPCPVGGWGGES